MSRNPTLLLAATATLLGLATAVRVSLFLVRFRERWPAMLCYGPEGAYMFETLAAVPIIVALGALVTASAHRAIASTAARSLALTAVTLGMLALTRVWQVINRVAGYQCDEVCERNAAWVWHYPLLSLLTQPVGAVALDVALTLLSCLVVYHAFRGQVA